MASIKVIFVTLLFILNESVRGFPTPRLSYQEADDLLLIFKANTREAYNEVISQLTPYPDIIQQIATIADYSGITFIQEDISVYQQQLEDIKSQAESSGIDITECLAGEDGFNQINQTGVSQLQGCTESMADATTIILYNIADQVDNFWKIAENIDRIFKTCPEDDEICIDVVVGLINENRRLPYQIWSYGQEALEQLAYLLRLNLEGCVTTVRNTVRDLGYNLVLEVSVCVDNISSQNNNH